ncbi:small integral membrane protein 33 [Empidonax traillii]|uniref:small integral membrane protein 33 n=1 Tax=Empidonax traillii TaxID=164674 RepID=UPI000FFD7DFA|nr:small integral membrane protein 33 [Empidonax traillii]
MNSSVPGSQLRPPEPQDVAVTPVSIARTVTRKADALPMISVIVVIFVLLAVLIILAVHFGPQLRTVHVTLYHEPLPQDLDSGVHLMHWKQLDPQGKGDMPGMDLAGVSCQCSCRHHLPGGSAEPNVIEVTYL